MPPPNVHALTNTMEGHGEASFSKAHDAELLCDPDAPFHVMLENINASSAFPSQSSSSLSSPVDVPQLQAPSDIGDYAPSEATEISMDTMITWRAAESVAGPAGRQVIVQAPGGQNDRPDTPVASQVEADHHQSRGFERSRHERLPSLANSTRPRSILDDWEPEPFDGTAGKRCCDFIQSIRKYAWKHGKNNDLKWIAEYAETRLTDDALVWHSRLPSHVRDDWRQLVSELLKAFYPGYSNDTENPLFTPGSSPSSRTTFSPSTSTSPSSSDGLRSPPLLSPLLSPPVGSQPALSQPSNRLVSMSSHVSLASSSSQPNQRGQLLIMDNNDEKYFVKIKLNGRGGCMPTTDKSKSLLVKNATGHSRRLYLDNCSSHHATLGISWCIEPGYTPHLSKGSLDCADLVYIHHNGSSSSRAARGPSRDMIWTVKDDNIVQAFWRDSEQIEHALHAVMKPESSFLKSLLSPARIVLVKDPDAFIPRNPGYTRSRLFFDA